MTSSAMPVSRPSSTQAVDQHAQRRLVRRRRSARPGAPRRSPPAAPRARPRRARAARPSKRAPDREGARDVGAVAVALGAGVDQQQLAGAQLPVVLDVVQDRGVGAGGDDRRIRRAGGAAAAEGVVDQRLDLVLAAARRAPRASRRRAPRRRSPIARRMRVELGRALEEAHLVQDRARRRAAPSAACRVRGAAGLRLLRTSAARAARERLVAVRARSRAARARPRYFGSFCVELVDRVGHVGAVVGRPRPRRRRGGRSRSRARGRAGARTARTRPSACPGAARRPRSGSAKPVR